MPHGIPFLFCIGTPTTPSGGIINQQASPKSTSPPNLNLLQAQKRSPHEHMAWPSPWAYGPKTMGTKTIARSTSRNRSLVAGAIRPIARSTSNSANCSFDEQFGQLLVRRANVQFLLVEQLFLVTLVPKTRGDESSAEYLLLLQVNNICCRCCCVAEVVTPVLDWRPKILFSS